uniref:molybdopterin-dependent oxidoreductase n=1 Tax=Turicimonas muris TaxID=1796652 RepID=UPI00402ADA4B
MSNQIIDLSVSRRTLMKGGAVAASMAAAPALNNWAFAKKIEKLEKEGWTKHPVACTMCGAFCGLLAMRKDGEPLSEHSVRIFPNPGHPQQGYCGRSAAAMWVWNHPLRLRKPLKRVGEKGAGQFEEVTWDEALNDIAARLKDIVQKNGESSVVSTSHSFSGYSKWLTFPLGSPNNIGHQSSCNAGGIAGRNLVFGKGFDGAGKMEPDYANLRYLILIGRSMGASMGALHTLNQARANGAKVVSIDPRMPDIAYGDADWVAIRPGTDGAFVASLINEMITQGTADLSFIEKHTNGAYLIKEDGQPLTQSDICSNGSKSMYVVMDSKGNISFRGLKKNEKGIVVGFDEDPAFKADLNAGSTVKLADGTSIPVKSAFVLVKEKMAEYTPEKTSEITGIPAGTIRRIAKEFADFKGVIDDGWYSSKNGTDVQLYQLISIANAINGNIDAKGGLVVTAGAGLKVPSVSAGKGPNGETWKMAPEKRIDKIVYPDAAGTFKVALEAAATGKPYPVKAAFFVGTTL